LEAGRSPSTLGQGFITTLTIPRALGGAGAGDGAALQGHSPARAWSLIQLRSWPISDLPWMKLIVAPPPAYIRIRFWMRLPLRHAGGAVVTRQVSYFIAQCVGLNILLNLLNFLPTFLPFCQSSPSREADEQLPTSYGCIRLANDVGIGGVGGRPHCNLASGDVILLLTHWPTPWP